MKQYIDGLIEIIKHGRRSDDRTGVGTISYFGDVQSSYLMNDGFPNMTLKSTWFKGIKEELLWFLNNVPDEYREFGNTNIKYLVDNDVNIWNEWPYERYKKYASNLEEPDYEVHIDDPAANKTRIMTQDEFVERIKSDSEFAKKWGDLGPVYGKQWVDWSKYGQRFSKSGLEHGEHLPVGFGKVESINQIKTAIEKLSTYPDDRGNIVSAWNVADLDQMALRPCHTFFQLKSEVLTHKERYDIFVLDMADKRMDYWKHKDINDVTHEIMDSQNIPRRRLSLKMYQRSADYFLGVPFNIASYSLLLHMIAKVTNHVPYKFIHTFGDAHIYSNHVDQVNELLNRTRGEGEENIDFFSVDNPEDYVGDNMGPELPGLVLPNVDTIWDFRSSDIKLKKYSHLGNIKAPVAV